MHVHPSPAPHEGFIPVENARLYFREVGQGQPIIILHGGPDFDHSYLLPELDGLSDAFHLIYYDQRGRGKSGEYVRPADVSIASENEDLESLRKYFQLESAAVLGHSWGGLLAMEYALRHPECVSRLILLNTGPASHADYLLFQQERRKGAPDNLEKLAALNATTRYAQGDLEMDARYCRLHFRTTVKRPEHLERLIKSLRLNFTPAGILKARAIEKRLMDETWLLSGYDLLPSLSQLSIPTLVLHGEDDFIPIDCAAHISQVIPGARLVVLRETGHFSYLENPNEVHKAIVDFLND